MFYLFEINYFSRSKYLRNVSNRNHITNNHTQSYRNDMENITEFL